MFGSTVETGCCSMRCVCVCVCVCVCLRYFLGPPVATPAPVVCKWQALNELGGSQIVTFSVVCNSLCYYCTCSH